MSDTLKDRLNSHSNAFEGLLSLIPAKYYYEDESKAQWNRKKKEKSEARQAKKAKFDPDSAGQSALDEANRRGEAAAAAAFKASGAAEIVKDTVTDGKPKRATKPSEDEDDDNVIVFDDYGNQISGPTASDDEASEIDIEDESSRHAGALEKSTPKKVQEPKVNKNQTPSKGKSASSSRTVETPSQNKRKIAQSEKKSEKLDAKTGSPDADATGDENAKSPARSPAGIEELRAKLAAKISELKAQRKAPGSDASGAPKNREELLAARQRRKEQRKRKADDPLIGEPPKRQEKESLVEAESSRDSDAIDNDAQDSVMYGQIKFDDGTQVNRTLENIEQAKKYRQRNATDQLKVLESRKAKLEQLDGSKRDAVKQNATWSRAILQSEGAKIRDDEKLLRKTVKQKQRRKLKSEKEWKARIQAVAQGKASREAKRNANIEARKEAKGSKKPGKKGPKKGGKPKAKGRAGFEGKH